MIRDSDGVKLDFNDNDPPVIVSHLTAAELVARLARAQSEGCVIGFKLEDGPAEDALSSMEKSLLFQGYKIIDGMAYHPGHSRNP